MNTALAGVDLYVDEVGLSYGSLSTSASQALGLQSCTARSLGMSQAWSEMRQGWERGLGQGKTSGATVINVLGGFCVSFLSWGLAGQVWAHTGKLSCSACLLPGLPSLCLARPYP